MYWTNAAIDVLLFFFVIDCALMCLVVLMQRSKQEGLGAAFGGGFTESVWGAQTSQVLVKATVWLAAIFFCLSIGLARLYTLRAGIEKQVSPIQQQLEHPMTKTAIPNTAAPGNPAGVPAGEAVVPTAAAVKPAVVPSQPAK